MLRSQRVTFVPQLELAECGAACLSMLLDYHGAKVPLNEARSACGTSLAGVSALAIVRAARSFGLSARAFRAETSAVGKLPLPAILHWEFNHFVVLEQSGRRSSVIVDPASGRRRVSAAEFDDAFTGVVITLEPAADFKERRAPSRSLARYIAVLRDCRAEMLLLAAFTLALEILGLSAPIALQLLVDHVLLPGRTNWLLPLIVVLALATVTQLSVSLLRDRLLVTLTHVLDLTLVSKFVDHLVHLPQRFLEQRGTGDLVQRVEANATLRDLSTSLVSSALDALLVLSYAALMLTYNPVLGTWVIATSLLRLVFVLTFSGHAQQLSAATLVLSGRATSAMLEGLTMPETIRAFGAEKHVIRRFTDRSITQLNASLGERYFNVRVSQLVAFYDAVVAATIIGIGGAMVLHEEITAGVLVGVLMLRNLLGVPLAGQIAAAAAFVQARGIIARIDDVLEAPRPPPKISPPVLRGAIRLENVSFRYAESSPSLCDELCLSIQPGEKVAFVGRTGAGKSTLGKLLVGLLLPTSGRICLDDCDLADVDLTALGQQMGVVLQEPYLFDDTVRANLALRRPDASFEELQRAARVACVDDVIERLPEGYDTRLGSGGQRLSRGQRQRVALARALVGSPRILVLDEATSSLDLETEARVHRELASLPCTRIIIAHRLATIRDAERIFVLDAGRIVQEGTFDALVSRDGPFRALVQAHAE